jgi:hypothetical protein
MMAGTKSTGAKKSPPPLSEQAWSRLSEVRTDPHFPTIEEAAKELEAISGTRADLWVEDMLKAYADDNLVLRRNPTNIPHADRDKHIRPYWDHVGRADLNQWLANNKLHYRLAELETEPPRKAQTPPAFVAAFGRMLDEIRKRAIDHKLDFDEHRMPGTKNDLWHVAKQFDAAMFRELSTFKTYIKGRCKFASGARPKETAFYSTLFPEYFNK